VRLEFIIQGPRKVEWDQRKMYLCVQ